MFVFEYGVSMFYKTFKNKYFRYNFNILFIQSFKNVDLQVRF